MEKSNPEKQKNDLLLDRAVKEYYKLEDEKTAENMKISLIYNLLN